MSHRKAKNKEISASTPKAKVEKTVKKSDSKEVKKQNFGASFISFETDSSSNSDLIKGFLFLIVLKNWTNLLYKICIYLEPTSTAAVINNSVTTLKLRPSFGKK